METDRKYDKNEYEGGVIFIEFIYLRKLLSLIMEPQEGKKIQVYNMDKVSRRIHMSIVTMIGRLM